jgi:DNA uptake protein ComE-like DNA-binding protein
MLRFYRALTTLSDGSRDYQPGQTLALSDEDAAALLALGYVENAQEPLEPSPPSPLSPLGEGEPEPSQSKNDTVSFLVDLNSATLAELVALPRIGEVTANKLIAARPLSSLQDAQFVAGMSNARWAEVAPLVEVKQP